MNISTRLLVLLALIGVMSGCATPVTKGVSDESSKDYGGEGRAAVAIIKTGVKEANIAPITGKEEIGSCTLYACGLNCKVKVESDSMKQVCDCPFGARVTYCAKSRSIEIDGACRCTPCEKKKLGDC